MSTNPPNLQQWHKQLAGEVGKTYRAAGSFACHFAKNKIRYDPFFSDFFQAGLALKTITDDPVVSTDLLDLGCGQGLLAMVLVAAQRLQTQGKWPQQRGNTGFASPRMLSYTGIEYTAANVARATSAFSTVDPTLHHLQCIQGNIVDAPFPAAKIITLIDVLHYLSFQEQEKVLTRVRSALTQGGRLVLRVGDAEARQGNRVSQRIDRIVSRWRGADSGKISCRGLSQWVSVLESSGFTPRVTSIATSMFYSNVLIVAELS